MWSRVAAGLLTWALLTQALAKIPDKRFCNGRGYRDEYGLCRCIGNYHGENCGYQYCPHGKSWLSPPTENDKRNTEFVECSNMGYCDMFTGECVCRDGYEGRACERLSCPSVKMTTGKSIPCGGHGVCMSMRDAGRGFDGYGLINPPVEYDNWDADRILGCVCDPGYEGVDCNRRSCPKGRDPTLPSTPYDVDEVFVLQCQASAGYFAIQYLGHITEPIPYDADAGYLQRTLSTLLSALLIDAEVSVRMPADSTTGLPRVCGESSVVSTEISFPQGGRDDWPPMRLWRNTSQTRQWPQGNTPLSLDDDSSLAVLRMSTVHTLSCPLCTDCTGKAYFSYRNATLSSGIAIVSTGAMYNLRTALLDVFTRHYGSASALPSGLNVSISTTASTDVICSATEATTWTIEVHSDYGNLPFFSLIDGSASTSSSDAAYLTFDTNAGNSTVYECSRQGTCDSVRGVCSCSTAFLAASLVVSDPDLSSVVDSGGGFLYRTVSGDGKGNLGLRGDCGHIETPLRACVDVRGESICSGHGACQNYTCSCLDGWAGITCAVAECPKGRAWFDEPITSTLAHRPVECSNAGTCDRARGLCLCTPGFSGVACELRDCPRDSRTGIACSGRGVCLSMRDYATSFNYTYGNRSTDAWTWEMTSSETWDADRMYECVCPGQFTLSGPDELISGTALSVPGRSLAGFSNWDCSLRQCPLGHISLPYFPDSIWEEQRVVCTKSRANASEGFRLKMFDAVSEWIGVRSPLGEIQAALTRFTTVFGDVDIYFPHADTDGIRTACDENVDVDVGGFVIRFVQRQGDLPLLQPVHSTLDEFQWTGRRGLWKREGADPYVYTHTAVVEAVPDVWVFNRTEGYSVTKECSGSALGYCVRETGKCVCNPPRGSSDGQGGPGVRGDCSWRQPESRTDDVFHQFGLYKNMKH